MKETLYIDLLVDFAFKKIFGTDTNKDLLIDLLNSIFADRKRIVDLIYNKNEHHGENLEEGLAVFDLLCTGEAGEKFIIEVQNSRPVNFKKRSIYYTSRLISEQAPKGKIKEWQYHISEVYFIAILDRMGPGPAEQIGDRVSFKGSLASESVYLHDVCLCYRATGEIFYEGLGYIYLELSNFTKALAACDSKLDKWLYHLKNLQAMKGLPNGLEKTIFEQLYAAAEYTRLTMEEQRMYDQDLKRKWDNAAVLANSREEGKAEGLEQGLKRGLEQGLAQGIQRIAREMKANGQNPELIMKFTKLSLEEIERL